MSLSVGAKVNHPKYGEGAIYSENNLFWKIFFLEEGEKEIGKEYDALTLVEESDLESSELSMDVIEDSLRTILEEYVEKPNETVSLGSKWEGGTMILKPADDGLKSKEITVESFFHKIVMMRDRLRVLEQNINSHKVLTDEEKVNLQQYITRCYGSMTTFNVLFSYKEDYFKGESK